MCLLLMAAVVTILRIIESNLNDDEKIMLELLENDLYYIKICHID